MAATLVSPEVKKTPRSRVLAIESDPRRARTLKNLLRDHDGAVLHVVKSLGEALESISVKVPELVLTSTFLPPADEAALIEHLKQLPGARHVQVINIPHFIDAERAETPSAQNVLSFLRRRQPELRPACDPGTLKKQIDDYLEEARTVRPALLFTPDENRVRPESPDQVSPGTSLVRSGETAALHTGRKRNESGVSLGCGSAKDRRLARRQRRDDLTWLWSVKLPWGAEVRVVDMSTTGVLMETTSKLNAGSTVELKLLGQNTNVTVPARAVRSEIASVDALGVTYRVAAAFANEVDVAGLQRANRGASLRPRNVADMLARVMAEVERCPGPSALRERFVAELRQLVPARDIQLLAAPASSTPDADSVYFIVPGKGQAGMVLQVTFEKDYEPSEVEFRFLQAAANAAAVVLEFAELGVQTDPAPRLAQQAGA